MLFFFPLVLSGLIAPVLVGLLSVFKVRRHSSFLSLQKGGGERKMTTVGGCGGVYWAITWLSNNPSQAVRSTVSPWPFPPFFLVQTTLDSPQKNDRSTTTRSEKPPPNSSWISGPNQRAHVFEIALSNQKMILTASTTTIHAVCG